MTVSKITHQMKPCHQAAIRKDQKSSGLTIKDWCSQNGIMMSISATTNT